MGSGRNCTPSATGKHMLHMFSNDVLEGDTEDKPTMMDDTVSQEDKDTDRETGGMETPRRQPGAGEQVQQGGSGARCSYTAGGICNAAYMVLELSCAGNRGARRRGTISMSV